MAAKSKTNDDEQDAATEQDPRAPIESEWAGLTKWTCPFCPRDSFDRAEIVAHIAYAHAEPTPSVTEAIAAQRNTAQQDAAKPTEPPQTNEPATPEKGEGA